MSSDIMIKMNKPVESEFLIQRARAIMADLLETPIDAKFWIKKVDEGTTEQIESISIVPDEETMPLVLLEICETTACVNFVVADYEWPDKEQECWVSSPGVAINFRADGGLSELLAAACGIVFAEVQGEDLDVCAWLLTREPDEDFITVDELKRFLQSQEWFIKFKEGVQKGTITLP